MIIRDYAGEIPGIMKVLTTILILAVSATSADNFCYQDIVGACNPASSKIVTKTPNCNAKYGSIDSLQGPLQHYANHFIYRSFNFLLMSTYYGNYMQNRPGFEKLYKSLSDSLWNDGIELIKYIDSRGGNMKFTNIAEELFNNTVQGEEEPKPNWELNELQSLATALDLEKDLIAEAFRIHFDADAKERMYDPEIAFHIEEEFLNKDRKVIRKLAGYTHDLGELLNTKDASLAVYLFDEILQNEIY